MLKKCQVRLFTILFMTLLLILGNTAQADPLPSWNEGPAKKAILDFV